MFNELDIRTQLALALMTTEKVYVNEKQRTSSHQYGIYNSAKCKFDFSQDELNFYIWRKDSGCAYVSIFMKYNSKGYCFISVENYFRAVARDTLNLDNSKSTFEDYLRLANNFPEPSVKLVLQGLSDGFKELGKLNEYNHYLGVATNSYFKYWRGN